ncbi:hypothetical protein AB6A40_010037 [Gnathostoma spinigerum]|uniref:Uncharacterized protein n=1 Tax=Gnathostoma spinigerum TaxID=75299 RepID=A0ABD6EU36_9BILA
MAEDLNSFSRLFYFGKVIVECICNSDVVEDAEFQRQISTITVQNFLRQLSISFSFDSYICDVCASHNHLFFLAKASNTVIAMHIDRCTFAQLRFDSLSTNAAASLNFETIEISVRVQQFKASGVKVPLIFAGTPELAHLNEDDWIQSCLQRNGSLRNGSALATNLICATDTHCYIVHNSGSGRSQTATLLQICAEEVSNEEKRVKTIQMDEGTTIVAICAGRAHLLLLSAGGEVFTLGFGNHGELGRGVFACGDVPMKVEMFGTVVEEIACGSWHCAVRTSDGDVFVWGWNKMGQLSDDPNEQQIIFETPEQIEVDGSVLKVGAARNMTVIDCGASSFQTLGTVSFMYE